MELHDVARHDTTRIEPVDPRSRRRRWFKTHLAGSDDPETDGELLAPTDEHPANLISSLCEDGLHRPALDIDTQCTVVPSSSPGHFHLYFPDVAMSWPQYMTLLDALRDAGIIGRYYVEHSIERGQSMLRVPGLLKEPK